MKPTGRQKHEDPTPEEIRLECQRIQASWSDRERMTRLRVDLRPTYRRADNVREELEAETYEQHHDSNALARCYSDEIDTDD